MATLISLFGYATAIVAGALFTHWGLSVWQVATLWGLNILGNICLTIAREMRRTAP